MELTSLECTRVFYTHKYTQQKRHTSVFLQKITTKKPHSVVHTPSSLPLHHTCTCPMRRNNHLQKNIATNRPIIALHRNSSSCVNRQVQRLEQIERVAFGESKTVKKQVKSEYFELKTAEFKLNKHGGRTKTDFPRNA